MLLIIAFMLFAGLFAGWLIAPTAAPTSAPEPVASSTPGPEVGTSLA